MKQKKIIKFLRKNYFLVIIILCIALVGTVLVARTLYTEPNYVYVKVKVGQGLWWANTGKPNIWYISAVNKGDIVKDSYGNNLAEVINKKYYLYQSDVYLTLKLKVNFNKGKGEYNFNRSVLSVSSPIAIQFPKVEITGTVVDINKEIFEEKLVEKTIYLNKRGALPWELSAIQVGDFYFDGEDKIFEILEKSGVDTSTLTYDSFGNSNVGLSEISKYITIKTKAMLKKVNGQWVLGEDQIIIPGRPIYVSTSNIVLDGYLVSKIE